MGLPDMESRTDKARQVIPAQAVEAAAAAIQVRTDQPLELEDLAKAALEAAAPHMATHTHHHDIEQHARSFNEGYATAVAHQQGVDMSEPVKAAAINSGHMGLRATIAREGFSLTDTLRGVSHDAELAECGTVVGRRTLLMFVNAGSVLVECGADVLIEAA